MKTSQLTLTKVKLADLNAILQLLRSDNLPVHGISENLDNFVAAHDHDGGLIGVAGVEFYRDSALLRSVVVSAERRGEGIGHLLVQHCVEESKKRGVQRLYLLTETAEKFMQRFGFRRIDKERVDSQLHESEEFKGACSDTAVTMLLEL